SGLIGRDDPDDVTIDTPVGSIGIRGTIIAGHIDPEGQSSITVVEGAIVVKNGGGEETLDQQFETVHIDGFNTGMEAVGVLDPADVSHTYGSASYVIPSLFSNINDVAKDQAAQEQASEEQAVDGEAETDSSEEQTTEEPVVQEMKEHNPDMVQDPADKPLEFKLMHEQGELREGVRKHLINNKLQAKQNEQEDLTNPDVIAAGNQPDFVINDSLNETSQYGSVVARMPDVPDDVRFFFIHSDGTKNTISEDGKFQIIGHAIKYTGSPLSPVGQNQDFGTDYEIMAIGPNGQTVYKTFDPIVHDINHVLTGAGQSAFENGFINLGDVDRAVDTNGQMHDDLAYIDGSGHVVINSGLSLGNIGTVTAHQYSSLAAIGDTNNDGYDDFIAGSSTNDLVVKLNYDGTSLTTTALAPGAGVSGGDNYGHSVTGLGDFDGDGTLDYAVGAPNTNTGNGSVYVHHAGGDYQIGTTDFNFKLGTFIAGVGDATGDGLSDLLIGGNAQSAAYLVHGGSGNISDVSAGGANITIIDTSASGRQILTGGSAGDFNGDGYDDFTIATTDGTDIASYVIFGNASMPTTITSSWLEDPTNAYKITDKNGDNTNYVVRSVGDLNNDGFDDIEVGSNATGYHVINGGMMGNDNYVTDGDALDLNALSDNIAAGANGLSLFGARNYYDGEKTGMSVAGDGRDNNITVTD
ncbi:MAG: hypothetical protein CUN56_13580, partial [Phototrophicales bacterium]